MDKNHYRNAFKELHDDFSQKKSGKKRNGKYPIFQSLTNFVKNSVVF